MLYKRKGHYYKFLMMHHRWSVAILCLPLVDSANLKSISTAKINMRMKGFWVLDKERGILSIKDSNRRQSENSNTWKL